MRKLTASMLIVLLSPCGCTQVSPPLKIAPAKLGSPVSCTVRRGSVVVRFSSHAGQDTRNPRYAGVSHGDDFIYLNYPPAHARFTSYTVHTRELTLNIASQQGLRYVNGAASRVQVFAKPGMYTLRFMDNLETEPDNTYSLQCQVRIPPR